jgi:prepilin-type N-terminal cleavage/methylation domain-containing protein
MRRKAFTLLEVLVAVTILGLAATGALRLAMISQKTVAEVVVQRELLDQARALQILLLSGGSVPDESTSGDLSWRIEKVDQSVMNDLATIQFRKLHVTYKNRSVLFYLP